MRQTPTTLHRAHRRVCPGFESAQKCLDPVVTGVWGAFTVLRTILLCAGIVLVGIGCVARDTAAPHPDFSGIYRPAGLEVQPCGRNEWMRRSFETDTFCNGDDSAFPVTAAGHERWKSYNVIDDPVLGCVEDFPRNAMRGRPMRIAVGEDVTEISYWFNNEWFVRTVHMDGAPPPADTPNSVTGYSTGRWVAPGS